MYNDNIFSIDKELLKSMLKLPNVVTYGIGKKITDGVITDEMSYIFGVTEKVDNLKDKDKIPKYINGHKTDVVIHEPIHTLTNCGTVNPCNGIPNDNDNCNELPHRLNHYGTVGNNAGKPVLKGGISAIRQAATACTFSLVARDLTDNRLVGLCCTHCFQCRKQTLNSTLRYVGTNYIQPSPNDVFGNLGLGISSTEEIVGTFKRDALVVSASLNNLLDAAIFDIPYPEVIPTTNIYEISVNSLRWATEIEVQTAITNNWKILKSGRTLGTFDDTYNYTIHAITNNAQVAGCYATDENNNGSYYDIYGNPEPNEVPGFDEVLWIIQSGTQKFGTGGDSSSPVLIKNPGTGELLVAGILFAGSCNNIFVIPIYNIATELNIGRWDGTCVVDTNGEPTITINGITHYRGNITNDPITHIKD
jgi:hypothetical protein